MIKIHIIKLLPATLSALLLAGCAHTVQNPYHDYSSNELRSVSSISLCNIVRNDQYIISQKVNEEARRRGFSDCSSSEVYCYSQLHLEPGTKDFAFCRLMRDEGEANRKMAKKISKRVAMSTVFGAMQPRTVNVNHSGYINHYVY